MYTHIYVYTYICIVYSSTAPSGPRPPHCRGFTITDTTHAVGLLWTSDRSVAETST